MATSRKVVGLVLKSALAQRRKHRGPNSRHINPAWVNTSAVVIAPTITFRCVQVIGMLSISSSRNYDVAA